jgi:hypothetical protein
MSLPPAPSPDGVPRGGSTDVLSVSAKATLTLPSASVRAAKWRSRAGSRAWTFEVESILGMASDGLSAEPEPVLDVAAIDMTVGESAGC